MQTNFFRNVTPHLKFYKSLGEGKTTADTIQLILRTVNTFAQSSFINKTVQILSVGNPDLNDFCKRLFDVACKLVKYERDPEGHEIVFTPKLLIEVGQGDCKKFTTFILSVLKAKGIKAAAKVVSYQGIDWEHIFVTVPLPDGYLTLDPVNHCRYNSEVNHVRAQLFFTDGTKSDIMKGNRLSLMGSLGNLSTDNLMSGISDSADEVLADIGETFGGNRANLRSCHNRNTLAGLGNDYMDGVFDENEDSHDIGKKGGGIKIKAPKIVQKVAQKAKVAVQKKQSQIKDHRTARKAAQPAKKAARKEKRKKIFKGAKKVGFAPVRGAFLGLILLGGALSKTKLKMNLAGRMAVLWKKDNGASLTKIWESFGGKRDALRAAIAKAAKTQLSGGLAGIGEQWGPSGSVQIEGIGIVTLATAATAVAIAAPLLIATTKLLNASGVTSDNEAALVEDVTEAAEDTAFQESAQDGKQYLKTQTKKAAKSALIKKAAEIDDGGNEATQREIMKEAEKEPDDEPAGSESENFAAEGITEEENFKGAAVKKSGSPAASTNAAAETNGSTENLPATKEQFAPAVSKSMLGNYKIPTTWLKGIIMLFPFQDYAIAPYLGGIFFSAFLVTTIRFSITQLTKKIYHEV